MNSENMREEIPTRYQPKETEEKWYNFWEGNGLFQAKPDPARIPYCIVIPPPNVTGILHMGHALNNTIQDVLIRYHRMKGRETLWVPGTDHAGIATQNVVERQLAEKGMKRQDLGREEFLKRVWAWREQYGSTIIRQLKKLGASCDWRRERFTMDEGLSRAVMETFVRLYRKGLIYQGNYIVNWCPRCQTALSDEESQHRDVEGSLYYIKYPFAEAAAGKGEDGIVVATTRPETMLGDTAVAVNPRDKRYRHLIGKSVILPVAERTIPVIADGFVDPKFGTGIVKVTPAHDPNDFEMGQRHKLEQLNVMNPDGTMSARAGAEFAGMDRFECREALLEELKQKKLLLKVEPHRHSVGHCYRCHTMVEPYLSRQWFVKMKPLAEPAIAAVKTGKIKFHPARWTKVYLNWMENIRDWCISRQIWWGHRIPVYYCKKCQETGSQKSKVESQKLKTEDGVIVSETKPDKCPHCGGGDIYQDEDVLDTWFSSWLWPFSVFGWPEENEDGRYFYPTSTLVTAPEIIFFWVARMIMAGCELKGEIPFRDVYIHGTVRDATGAKMSKSLGNVIDPLEIIGDVGADALRFSIISITAAGQDVFLSKEKFLLGRNFGNKIWNASRFLLMNLEETPGGLRLPPDKELDLFDRWILSRLNQTVAAVTVSLDKFRFNEAANRIYDFFWHEFCDWYVELAKPYLGDAAAPEKKRKAAILGTVLETTLRLLHPFMPFITEDVWQRLPHEGGSIMTAPWPRLERKRINKKLEEEARLIMEIITQVRNVRAEMSVPIKSVVKVKISLKEERRAALERERAHIERLAGAVLTEIGEGVRKEKGLVSGMAAEAEVFVDLKDVIDVEKEKQRLEKKTGELSQMLARVEGRLKNEDFVKKAPPEVVESEKKKAEELKNSLGRLKNYLEGFQG